MNILGMLSAIAGSFVFVWLIPNYFKHPTNWYAVIGAAVYCLIASWLVAKVYENNKEWTLGALLIVFAFPIFYMSYVLG
jgi:apolipoprotein N-acyltransferase